MTRTMYHIYSKGHSGFVRNPILPLPAAPNRGAGMTRLFCRFSNFHSRVSVSCQITKSLNRSMTQFRLPARQRFDSKSKTSCGLALCLVRGNEQFRRPLGGASHVQGIRRSERPALQKLNCARHDLVRKMDDTRIIDVPEQRVFGFGVLLHRESAFASQTAKCRDHFGKTNDSDSQRRGKGEDFVHPITSGFPDVSLGQCR